MKKLIFIFLLCVSSQAYALVISGVKLEEKLQLNNHQLELNGAGIRSKFVVNVYVVALYLSEKLHTAQDVLADTGPNRISIHLLRDVSGKLFSDGLNISLLANQSQAEMKVLDPKVDKLLKFVATVPQLKKGEIVNLDYIPGLGTKILINGVDKGYIEGFDFNRALLKIWLGNKPVRKSVKDALLGEEEER